MKDYMTVKEIADICERTVGTVTEWIKKVYPSSVEQGKETRLSIEEVESIFNKVFGKVITAMIMNHSNLDIQGCEYKKTENKKEEDFGYFYCIELLNKKTKEFIATKIGITRRFDKQRFKDYETIEVTVGETWSTFTCNFDLLEKIFIRFFKEYNNYGREYFNIPWEKAISYIEVFVKTGRFDVILKQLEEHGNFRNNQNLLITPLKDIRYVQDDQYGRIGQYHIDVLDQLV